MVSHVPSSVTPPPGTSMWIWGWLLERPGPGVEDREGADTGAEVAGIGAEVGQCIEGAAEEDGKQNALLRTSRRHEAGKVKTT